MPMQGSGGMPFFGAGNGGNSRGGIVAVTISFD